MKKNILPMIPLRGIVVFPGMVTHFDCGRSKSIGSIEQAELNNSNIFLTAQKNELIVEPKEKDLYKYGTVAAVKQILRIPGGTIRILIEGLKRGKIEKIIDEETEDLKGDWQVAVDTISGKSNISIEKKSSDENDAQVAASTIKIFILF